MAFSHYQKTDSCLCHYARLKFFLTLPNEVKRTFSGSIEFPKYENKFELFSYGIGKHNE